MGNKRKRRPLDDELALSNEVAGLFKGPQIEQAYARKNGQVIPPRPGSSIKRGRGDVVSNPVAPRPDPEKALQFFTEFVRQGREPLPLPVPSMPATEGIKGQAQQEVLHGLTGAQLLRAKGILSGRGEGSVAERKALERRISEREGELSGDVARQRVIDKREDVQAQEREVAEISKVRPAEITAGGRRDVEEMRGDTARVLAEEATTRAIELQKNDHLFQGEETQAARDHALTFLGEQQKFKEGESELDRTNRIDLAKQNADAHMDRLLESGTQALEQGQYEVATAKIKAYGALAASLKGYKAKDTGATREQAKDIGKVGDDLPKPPGAVPPTQDEEAMYDFLKSKDPADMDLVQITAWRKLKRKFGF